MPPGRPYQNAQDPELQGDISRVFGMLHDISFRDGTAAPYSLVERNNNGDTAYFTLDRNYGNDNSLTRIGHHGMNQNALNELSTRLRTLQTSGDFSTTNINRVMNTPPMNGMHLSAAEIQWLSERPERIQLMQRTVDYTTNNYAAIHGRHVFEQKYYYSNAWYNSYREGTARGTAIDRIAFQRVQADPAAITGIASTITSDGSLLPPPIQFDNGAAALAQTRAAVTTIANALKPNTTFGTNEATVLRLISEGKTAAEIAAAVPSHNFDPAQMTALIALGNSAPNKNLLGKIGSYINNTPSIAHATNDGRTITGITAADLRALTEPGSNFHAQTASAAFLSHLNGQALVRNGEVVSSFAVTATAPVDAPTQTDETLASGLPVQLDPALSARVGQIRTLLAGTGAIDATNLNNLLKTDGNVPYRQRMQLLRQALFPEGTPASYVNEMNEDQVREALRTRLGDNNLATYFQLVSDGDPGKARTDLTAVEARNTGPGPVRDFITAPGNATLLHQIRNNGLSTTSTLGPVRDQNEANIQTGRLAQDFAEILARSSGGETTALNREKINTLAGIFNNANAVEAETQLTQFCTDNGITNTADIARLRAMYTDPTSRRLAGNLFTWMHQNTGRDSGNDNIAGIDGTTTATNPTVSVRDLRVFAGALGNSPFGNDDQKARAASVLTDFSTFTGNRLPQIVDPTRSGGTPTYTPAAPVATTAPVYTASPSTFINTGMGNMPSFNYSPIASTGGMGLGVGQPGSMPTYMPTFNYFGDSSSNLSLAYMPGFSPAGNPGSAFTIPGFQPSPTFASIYATPFSSPFLQPYTSV